MKLKKYLIVIFLIVVLVGVAYIKAIFSNQDDGNPNKEELDGSISTVLPSDDISRDQAALLVDSVRQFFIDSLAQQYSALLDDAEKYSKIGDSLTEAIKNTEGELNKANQRVKELEAAKKKQLDILVYKFYSGELASLPADLSDYERSVSIKEIKGKTRKYFGVSSNALKQIIKKKK